MRLCFFALVDTVLVLSTALSRTAAEAVITEERDCCKLPEFEACDNCMNLDFHLKYFYGCGVTIRDASINM